MKSSIRTKLALAVPVLVWSCAKATLDNQSPLGGQGGQGGRGGAGGRQASGGSFQPLPCEGGVCTDFPAAPILDEGVPNDAAARFRPGQGAAPCVLEPEDGSLFPRNWLRPRIRWRTASPAGLTKITITSPGQARPLVVYTQAQQWLLPKSIWMALSAHAQVSEIFRVTVEPEGALASTVQFSIAPTEVGGTLVFWAAKPSEVGKDPGVPGAENDSDLRALRVGDETVVSALRIPQVEQPSKDLGGNVRRVRCIGCHVGTPDGASVVFVDHWPWNLVIAGIKPDTVGKSLPELSAGGLATLNQPWGGMPTTSAQHWRPGDRVIVLSSSLVNPMNPSSVDNRQVAKLVWYDLESPEPPLVNGRRYPVLGRNFGVLARNGDTGGAASPSWSHFSDVIVYASTQGGNLDGRLSVGRTDLYTVPYGNRAGGDARPVPGASEPGFEEYYPAYAPDDKLIVFNRVPAGETMYANRNAELFVVSADSGQAPAQGGQAIRLIANSPPACSGKTSPGVNNHWARWAPIVSYAAGASYYWLVFSSNRADIPPVMSRYTNPEQPNGKLVEVSQLYITAILVPAEGSIQTFPAIYLWNQPTDTLNTTPVWEVFQIPPAD